jgi:uncharacterized membrane protein
MKWESTIRPDAVRLVLGTMASSMFTFIVFVSSALLIAVQLASSQLTPRIIAIVFNDPIIKSSLSVFVFTFTFTLAVLVRVNETVPLLTTYVSAYGCLLNLGFFLYLIDHVGKSLRPSGALWAVALLGREVIQSVYPQRFTNGATTVQTPSAVMEQVTYRNIQSDSDGVVVAFDTVGLVSLAKQFDCVIEMVPQVGDFVAVGDPLFRIFQETSAVPNEALYHSIALGQERTLEQDPAFTFRIIVDIASKGLSPAINDPTTAVLALDQIHHLLLDVGTRRLDDERLRDREGRLRLLYRTPDWEDYVRLSVTEIRQFGGSSIQVARRLRAMLENLIQMLPEQRAVLLRQELTLLQRSAERFFAEPEDRAMAEVSDFQGVGGKGRRSESDRDGNKAMSS